MQERLREQLERHPSAITAGVIGGALALVVIAVGLAMAVFSGAQPAAEASPVPSTSVSPSASPTDEVSPSAAESTIPTSTPFASPSSFTDFNYADILRVDVNGLAVRQSPSLTSPLAQGSRFDGAQTVPTGDVRLNAGEFVSVELGSLPIGDVVWYLVWPAEDARFHYAPTLGWQGWVAASVGEDEYLSWYRRTESSEYESWTSEGPQTLMVSGTGDYESEPQVQHDMFAFYWAVAADDHPSPCAFSVTMRSEGRAEPVTAIETSTSGVDLGPTDGPSSVLNTPWAPAAETSSDTFTVSISSGCTWAVRLWPLAHD
jgi:hypothetical protein